ncbi:MAG: carbohydrate ABC transporter permease [Saccharofermentanales bacterium]
MKQITIMDVLSRKYDSAMNGLAGKKGVKKISRFLTGIGRAVFLFSLCLVLLYPIFIMLSVSLRNANELYDPTVIWIPKTITFDAFTAAYKYLDFLMIALKTLKISVIGTALQLIACIMAGYGFARHNFPFKKLLFGILILSIIIPSQVTTIPSMVYFQNFDFFGIGSLIGLFTGKALTMTLMNSELAYYLPAILGSGIKSGLFIFILIQFFRGLPYELSDAAYIDGCGRFRTFLQIMLPLAGGAILTVLLFSLVWYWNDSLFSAIFFDNLRTVSTVLQNIRNELIAAQNNNSELAQIPQMQAAALMSIAPLLAMYVILQKYFTESIERTGIVG